MSTSVYYKDAKLIDVDNNTKTLLTAGKYLEDNVILTDVTVYQTHTVTLTNSGSNYMAYIEHNGVSYYSSDDVIDVSDGDTIKIWLNYGNNNILYVNEEKIAEATAGMAINYTYTVTSDVEIRFSLTFGTSSVSLTEISDIQALSVTENGTYTASGTTRGYSPVTVNVPNPLTSSLTVTPTESQQTFNATGVYGYKPVTVNAISSTYVGTGVAKKSSADTTFASATGTFTAPVGYYSTAATKTITTQAAQTIYPSTADQTISSYRWLTGSQTIKSVTTSNLTAENIAEGVVVKVGDTTNASRITQVTGTHKGGGGHDAVLLNAGTYNERLPQYTYVSYNGTRYYTNEDTFNFNEGDTIETLIYGTNSSNVYLNNTLIGSGMNVSFSAPSYPLAVYFSVNGIYFNKAYPSGTLSITSNGTYNVYGYSAANVSVSSNDFIVTLSQNAYSSFIIDKTFSEIISACKAGKKIAAYGDGSPYYTGAIDVDDEEFNFVEVFGYSYSGNDYLVICEDDYALESNFSAFVSTKYYYHPDNMNATPSDVLSGKRFVNESGFQVGTATTLTFPTATSGTRVGNVIANLYPSSTNQFLNIPVGYNSSSQAYVMYGVNTVNLTAENIAEGVTVKIGDQDDASRIAQITGTHSGLGSEPYRCYIISNESPNLTTPRVKYGGKEYRSAGSNFLFNAGDSIELQARGAQGGGKIFIDGRTVSTSAYGTASYTYTPATNFDVLFSGYIEVELYVNTYTPTSEISGGDGFTADEIAMRTIVGDISGNATSIGSYAFQYCSALTTASFPNATSIGVYAFRYCSALTTASFPSATSIYSYAFANCSALTIADFPNVVNIYSSAFYDCRSLTTASFPSATSVGTYAFYSCYALTTVSFPNVTSIGNYTFYDCSALTTLSFPSATSVGTCAFQYCSALTTVSFPNATYIGNYAFGYCYSLETASFPNVRSIGSYTFYDCSALTTLSFPSATRIGSSAFCYCTKLTTASFPKVTSIMDYAFMNCFNLLSFYLLGSSVPTLGTSVFYSTPIDGYTTSTGGVYGSIFVPSSLYNQYIVATNWSLISDRIVSV